MFRHLGAVALSGFAWNELLGASFILVQHACALRQTPGIRVDVIKYFVVVVVVVFPPH